METLTFSYSKSSLKSKKIMLWLMAFFMPVLVFFFVAVAKPLGTLDLASTLRMIFPALVLIVILFGASSLFFGHMTLRKLGELKVSLGPEGLERQGGKFRESIPYSALQKVVMVEQKKRGVVYVKVFSPNGSLILSGFENMGQLWLTLKERIGPSTSVQNKMRTVDWENPWALLGLTSIVAVVFVLLTQLSPLLDRDLPKVFNVAFALYLIFYRPLTKAQGARFRKWEWTLGGIILSLTVLSFVLRFLSH